MYVTAQLVRSPEGAVGVNAFLYEHGAGEAVEPLNRIDVALAPPGELLRRSIEISPGGNFVDAYLDVVFDESQTVEQVHDALNAIQLTSPKGNVETGTTGKVYWRYYCSPRTALSQGEQLNELAAACLQLLRLTDSGPTVVIRETVDDDGDYFYSLDPDAIEFLKQRGALDYQRTLRITADVFSLLEARYGTVYPHVVQALVPNLEAIHVRAVEVRTDSDAALWRLE